MNRSIARKTSMTFTRMLPFASESRRTMVIEKKLNNIIRRKISRDRSRALKKKKKNTDV